VWYDGGVEQVGRGSQIRKNGAANVRLDEQVRTAERLARVEAVRTS